MARFQYKLKDFYNTRERTWGKQPRPCDYCQKPLPKGSKMYETSLMLGYRALTELAEIPYTTGMALDFHFFCSAKCLKAQCIKHGEKTMKEYIDEANRKIREMSQDEYDNYIENELFTYS